MAARTEARHPPEDVVAFSTFSEDLIDSSHRDADLSWHGGVLNRFELTVMEWKTLQCVACFPSMQISWTTPQPGVNVGEISRALRDLTARGLVHVSASTHHRSRAEAFADPHTIRITPAGAALYAAVLQAAQVKRPFDWATMLGPLCRRRHRILIASQRQGSLSIQTHVRENGAFDMDFTVNLQDAQEYEVTVVKRLLSNDLRALVTSARQDNATERLVQLLRALAPEDPLAALQLNVAATTVSLRQEFLSLVPVLTSAEVHAHAGFPGGNPSQTALRWRKPGKIFAISHGGRELYPAFQFDADGRPLPIIATLLTILRQDTSRSDWDHALWFIGECGWLDGKTPLECLLSDPAAVTQAAHQEVLSA